METAAPYQELTPTEGNTKVNKYLVGVLAVTCIALIVVSIIAGLYGAQLQDKDSKEYCMTPQCLQTVAEITSTINTSVDPCQDFYHYVCDGWDNDNSWTNLDFEQFGQFLAVDNHEKDTFLDALFYNTKDELVGYNSVQQAAKYFESCHNSDDEDTEHAVASLYMQMIIHHTTFVDPNNTNINSKWDKESISAFQTSLTYLTMLGYNPFFKLDAKSHLVPEFQQLIGLWAHLYDPDTLDVILDAVFVPLYMELFGADANSTQSIAALVGNFTRQLANITTVNGPAYQDPVAMLDMTTMGSFEDLPNIFGSHEIMDYRQLVYSLWNVPQNVTIEQFQYLSAGVDFFQNLGPLLESVSPLIVQFYIQFTVAFYDFNFNSAYTQKRDLTRTDFCFESTKNAFPYVYGYILFNELYDDHAFETATTLAEEIKLDGTKTLIESADWLDEKSRAAALKKIEHMDIFIGYPPRLENGEDLDKHYALIPNNMTDGWMHNMFTMAMFSYHESYAVFWGESYNLTNGWPWVFSDPSGFDAWLTGINAFYFPPGNWFTIPVTISQPPFFAASEGYPSSLIYGGLGWIAGHEMSHGFDPDGSQYNWNGTEVPSIFSNYSLNQYNAKMDCFKQQYNAIAVDIVNNTALYDNGTQTLAENVADNAGMRSSWTAWRKYIKKHGTDSLLHGLDLSQEQLFFVGSARIWCQTEVRGSYAGDADEHSPNYARVIGTLQNMPEFAEAFECSKGSRMNPKDRCIVW